MPAQPGSPAPAEAAGGPAIHRWLLPLLLVVAGILAFHSSFDGAFQYDDEHAIVDNPNIRQWWPPSVAMSGTTRPVARYSFALNYAAGGTATWGYHAINLAIHILAGLALYGIVRRTLGGGALAARYARAAPWLAAAAAGLWLVHPLQTESVTYIVQRDESLMGLAYLMTLYCSIRALASPHPGRWSAAAVAACALGMGTKEVMVSAPILVVLYDRAFAFGSFADAWRRRAPLYAGLAATWLVLAVLLLQGGEQWARNVQSGSEPSTVLGYALTQPDVILHYLRLALWPQPLVLDYKWPIADTLATIAPGAIAIAALLAVTAYALWRLPALGFLGAWFFLILAPTSSVVPIADLAFEHRMYLPLASIAVAVVVGLYELCRYAGRKLGLADNALVAVQAVVLVAAIGALAFATARRNEDYRTPLAMWSDVTAKRPDNPRAHNNRGTALRKEGRLAEAMAEYQEALRLQPQYADAHYNIGSLLVAQDRLGPEALMHLREAIRANPGNADAQMSLGLVLNAQGRIDEAAARFREAIHLKPDFAQAYDRLALLRAKQGRIDEAIAHYMAAIRVQPDYPEARIQLGALLATQGRTKEAEAQYAAAGRSAPDAEARAHFEQGNALDRQGKPLEAIVQYREALRVKPDFVPALSNLGGVLYEQGRAAEAVVPLQEAVRLQPDFAAARGNLGAALFAQGKVAEALVHLNAAVRLTPESASAHHNLALALLRNGEPDAASDQFAAAVRLDPRNAKVRNDYAAALLRQGKSTDAAAQYAEVLRIDPENAQARNGRAAALGSQTPPGTKR